MNGKVNLGLNTREYAANRVVGGDFDSMLIVSVYKEFMQVVTDGVRLNVDTNNI